MVASRGVPFPGAIAFQKKRDLRYIIVNNEAQAVKLIGFESEVHFGTASSISSPLLTPLSSFLSLGKTAARIVFSAPITLHPPVQNTLQLNEGNPIALPDPLVHLSQPNPKDVVKRVTLTLKRQREALERDDPTLTKKPRVDHV